MPALLNINCTSAEEFLERIRRSNEFWWKNGTTSTPWFFRGIGDVENWKLVPSAWREHNNKLCPLMKRISNADLIFPHGAADGIFRQYYEWHATEQEALHQFAALANEVGFSINSTGFMSTRSPLITRRAQFIRGEEIFPDIELMALAQHHGIPTRLLDWTADPIIAAFFAASPLFRPREAKQICVWALDTSQIRTSNGHPQSFKRFRLFAHTPARGQNHFLHSQRGMLTELLGSEYFFLKNGRWPSLEEVFSAVELPDPIIIGHTLDAEHVNRLLTLLDREGINSAVLMPTLDNVSKTVISRWESEK